MQLLTKAILNKIPPLMAQDGKGLKAIAHVKFFTPDGSWTWYATEFDGKDTFFGYVIGQEKEFGYFSLSELQTIQGPMGLHVEKDRYFKPKSLEKITELS
jgi:hypothetical protein